MNVSAFRRMILFMAVAMAAAVLAQAQQAAKDPKAAKPVKEASAAQKPADSSAVFLRDVANAGFKPEHVRGNVMYCRTTTEIGSNFPVKTCYNEEQVRVKISEYEAERLQMQRQGTLPQFCNKTYAPQC